MAPNQPPRYIVQTFSDDERLFRRVPRDNLKPDGKATLAAFELPDMSVNRAKFSTAEEARKGFRREDWGVVSIRVGDMPPREALPQCAHCYRFQARHIPETGNFAHSEVRVWREERGVQVLITNRLVENCIDEDPDREGARVGANELDPDFHMRWRKRMSLRCKPELRPDDGETAE
jgi:hypothetical protein